MPFMGSVLLFFVVLVCFTPNRFPIAPSHLADLPAIILEPNKALTPDKAALNSKHHL